MNLFVADPGWGWWIIFYFYLGGIAAGAYFIATLIELQARGGPGVVRGATGSLFLLISLCGILLIVDLHRPERFWHMLFRSEVVDEALLDGLALFGRIVVAHLARAALEVLVADVGRFLGALAVRAVFVLIVHRQSSANRAAFARLLHHGIVGKILACIGSSVGFFIAAYTGALLTATNQPIWSDSVWIAPLFLTSAASTGVAAMILLVCWRGKAASESVDRLERAEASRPRHGVGRLRRFPYIAGCLFRGFVEHCWWEDLRCRYAGAWITGAFGHPLATRHQERAGRAGCGGVGTRRRFSPSLWPVERTASNPPRAIRAVAGIESIEQPATLISGFSPEDGLSRRRPRCGRRKLCGTR